MVKGLLKFKEHFQRHTDQFVLIGGTACDLVMTDAGLTFRATKDIDVVLFVEALTPSFVQIFWEFIRLGNYQAKEKASGGKQYYRFTKPTNAEYPIMLELFTRIPDALTLTKGSLLTPIPTEEGISSLSAILLDDEYYEFLQKGKKEVDGLPIVGAEHLIVLKAKAWLDLTARKERGEAVDAKNILKHKNDVFRLFQIVDPEFSAEIPVSVKHDMRTFLQAISSENVDLKNLGIKGQDFHSVLRTIRILYKIE